MRSKVARIALYLAVPTLPIVGSYDYGTYDSIQFTSIWQRLIVSAILAVIIAAIGETALFVVRKFRRR